MKNSFNLKKYINKYFGKIILFAGIVLVFCTQVAYYFEKGRFSFPSRINYMKVVQEEGRIKYGSKEPIDIFNNYKANETVERSGSKLSVTGDIEGDIDPYFAPFVKSMFYYASIDLNDISSICEESFNPLYPVLLRRLSYYMPRTNLFDGQSWILTACEDQFVCNYSFLFKEKKPFVDYFCSGIIGGNNIALTGEIEISLKYSGIVSSNTEVTVSSPYFLSNWTFTDEIKPK